MKLVYYFMSMALICVACNTKKNVESSAVMVGGGIISSENPEFATSVNSNETELFFNRTCSDRKVMQIALSKKMNGEWTEPTTLPFSTGEFRDVDPFLTYDDKRLYFSSDRPVDTTKIRIFNTWYVDRDGDSWSKPYLCKPPLNSDSTEIFISMTKKGNAYFVSERDSIRGIVRSTFENGQFQPVKHVNLKLRNKVVYASNPCISSDETFLIVAVRDPEGNGHPDLFISFNINGKWSELINMGSEINSSYAEFAPALTKNDRVLYFSSERPGIVGEQEEGVRPPGDIYRIELVSLLKKLKEKLQ